MKILSAIIVLTFSIISCTDYRVGEEHLFVKNAILPKNNLIDTTTIYPDVTDYAANKNFIIAKQIPNRKMIARFLSGELYAKFCHIENFVVDGKDTSKENLEFDYQMSARDSLVHQVFLTKGATVFNSKNDLSLKKEIADSFMRNDPIYMKIISNRENYWIIDQRKKQLLGPLTHQEYLKKREELAIPKNLRLE